MDYKLRWSEEAIKNLEEILSYLNEKWTIRETENFKLKLSKQLDLIIRFPLMFPKSLSSPRLRKAVLSTQTTLFYEVKGDTIFLAYIFVSKKDFKRIV